MRPGDRPSLRDRWAAFSHRLQAAEKRYFQIGLEWHHIPPRFRELYLVSTGRSAEKCDDSLLVTQEGLQERNIPDIMRSLYLLHDHREAAQEQIWQGLDKEATDHLDEGERLLRLVESELTDLASRVDRHNHFFFRAQNILHTPAAQRIEADAGLERFIAALPETVKALELGTIEEPMDAYRHMVDPEEFVTDDEDEDTDDDTDEDEID